jgi:hypothetical protein
MNFPLWLVVTGTMEFYDFPYIDELKFFRGVGIPATSSCFFFPQDFYGISDPNKSVVNAGMLTLSAPRWRSLHGGDKQPRAREAGAKTGWEV